MKPKREKVPLGQLAEFLENAFKMEELEKLFVEYGYDDTVKAAQEGGPTLYAFRLADGLNRRKQVNTEFFDLLEQERDNRQAEIDKLRKLFGCETEPAHVAASPAGPLRSSDSRRSASGQPEPTNPRIRHRGEHARRGACATILEMLAKTPSLTEALRTGLDVADRQNQDALTREVAAALVSGRTIAELLYALDGAILRGERLAQVRSLMSTALPWSADYDEVLSAVRRLPVCGMFVLALPVETRIQGEFVNAAMDSRASQLERRGGKVVGRSSLDISSEPLGLRHNPEVALLDSAARALAPNFQVERLPEVGDMEGLTKLAKKLNKALTKRLNERDRRPPFYAIIDTHTMYHLDLLKQHLPSLRIVALSDPPEDFDELSFNDVILSMLREPQL